MAVMLFAELWLTLPTVGPLDTAALADWLAKLTRQARALRAQTSTAPPKTEP
jgi:hypothetical protein